MKGTSYEQTVTKAKVIAKWKDIESNKFYINPKWKSARRWDLVMVLLLAYTAIFTPYEVAFLETKLDALFIFNRLVDLAFSLDIIINLFLAVSDPETGRTVTDLAKI